MAEVEETFQAWYDAKTNNSRIDYYGGTVKTFQLGYSKGDYGKLVKIFPITTEKVLNELECLQYHGSWDNYVEPQSILPDCTDFKWAGM